MSGSNQSVPVAAAVAVLIYGIAVGVAVGEEPTLRLRAVVIGAPADRPLTIELLRWSTDAERAPLVAALSVSPPPAAAAAASTGGRGGRAGRGGRGGAPPASPADRLASAVTAAPTVGFIWGDGPTGYSIKYAWRAASPNGHERIVLVTDRRLGAHAISWPATTGSSAGALAEAGAAAGADFTAIEIRLDATGTGEGKASLTANMAVDAAAKTLALEGYDTAPALFKVTR